MEPFEADYNEIKQGERSRIDCFIPTHLRDLIRESKPSMTERVIRGIYCYEYCKIVLYKIYCPYKNRAFIGVAHADNIYSGSLINVAREQSELLRLDVLKFGAGEFKTEVIAHFWNREEAAKYYEFCLHKEINDGVQVYNVDHVGEGRIFSIRVHGKLLKLITKLAVKRSISVNKIIEIALKKLFKKK